MWRPVSSLTANSDLRSSYGPGQMLNARASPREQRQLDCSLEGKVLAEAGAAVHCSAQKPSDAMQKSDLALKPALKPLSLRKMDGIEKVGHP